MRHLLYILSSLGAIGIGANLHYQIASGSSAVSIGLTVFSCVMILIALYYTCKLWYSEGSLNELRKLERSLEEAAEKIRG